MRASFLLPLFALLLSLPGLAQQNAFKNATPAGEAPGPWQFATIGVGKGSDGKPLTTALKGVAIKVGTKGEAGVAYDLDLCRIAGGWSGGKFVTPMNLMSRGEYPSAMSTPAFLTSETPGLDAAKATAEWHDPRSEPFGALPEVRYRGLYVAGDRVVLKWRVGTSDILESPWYEKRGELEVFSRDLAVPASTKPLSIVVCRLPDEVVKTAQTVDGIAFFSKDPKAPIVERGAFTKFVSGGRVTVVTDFELPDGAEWKNTGGQLVVTLPPLMAPARFRLLIGQGPENLDTLPPLTAEPALADFALLTKGGKAHWPETVATKGELSKVTDQPYVVDTIRLPDPNPWGAPLFVGGLDFLPDGRVAICTFHGDVFIGSGIDAGLENVTWRRFATGLYHALGLKVVDGEIYVTGRDGITKLRDLNGDGEADAYEVFNWDVKVTKSFHEFVFDLQTDPAGNFLFAKAGPVRNGGRGFDQICEHHGCLFSVTPDGRELSVVATGFRAPNGIGVGPHGEMTTGDNEGTWTPVCRINWVNRGGFYGVVDLAHRPQAPTDYDKPLCWLPKRIDNSSGSQVWATSKKWGPWGDRMLHLSYGTSSLFGVLMEGVNVPEAPDCCSYVMQGGVVPFNLKFESGIMRARFNPVDGQLYVAGLRGWQTNGLRNGCLQRVRYTGDPVRMPLEINAKKGGLEIKFANSLDTQKAADPENWNIEVWNYIWSSAYGSPEVSTLTPGEAEKPTDAGKNGGGPEFSAAQMKKSQHDPVTVKSVTIGTDDRTVFLEIPDLKPVMQMSIKYRLRGADGADFNGEIVNTIHATPKE